MNMATLDDPRLRALGTIACSVPPGAGGLGQHFDELRRVAKTFGLTDVQSIHPSTSRSTEPGHIAVRRGARGGQFLAHVPMEHAYPWFVQAACLTFDWSTSRAIPPGTDGFTGFASHSLLSFRRARRLGVSYLGLAAPNSHVDNFVS